MPRGGRRAGTPGVAYGQRSDLNSGKPLPPTAVTGQPYGAAGAQLAAQKAIPMQGTPVPSPAPTTPPAGAGDTGPMPGELTGLTDPTMRPNEPLTHGLAVGPGAGPEILPSANATQFQTGRDLIASLAASGGSPALDTLAAYARNGL